MVGFITRGEGVGRRVIPINSKTDSLERYKTYKVPVYTDAQFVHRLKKIRQVSRNMKALEDEVLDSIGKDKYLKMIGVLDTVNLEKFDARAYFKEHKLDMVKVYVDLKAVFYDIPKISKKLGVYYFYADDFDARDGVAYLEARKMGLSRKDVLSMLVMYNANIYTDYSKPVNDKIGHAFFDDLFMAKKSKSFFNYKIIKNRMDDEVKLGSIPVDSLISKVKAGTLNS